ANLDRDIALARSGHIASARALIDAGASRDAMVAFRAQKSRLDSDLRDFQAEVRAKLRDAWLLARVVLALAVFGGFLISLAMVFMAGRYVVRRLERVYQHALAYGQGIEVLASDRVEGTDE